MFSHCRVLALVALLGTSQSAVALAQRPGDSRLPEPTQSAALAGPRFGVTLLTPSMRARAADEGIKVGPVISQFGWQFERQFLGSPGGLAAVTEWVVLVGGLEQGTFLPSLSWLLGLRGPRGSEFGFGPNLSASGASLVIAAGVTNRSGALNIPVNLAVVPSRDGVRLGILSGWTMR